MGKNNDTGTGKSDEENRPGYEKDVFHPSTPSFGKGGNGGKGGK